MKRSLLGLALLALCVGVGLYALRSPPKPPPRVSGVNTRSSFDPPSPGEKVTPAHGIKFEQAELAPVLNLYAETSGRSIIRAGNLPDVKFTFSNQTAMTSVEVLQALDTLLAAQGVTMVYQGTQYVKVVPAKEAHQESPPVVELKWDELPDSSSFLVYVVKLKNVTPSQAASALQPFAKLPNSIIAIGSGGGGPAAAKAGLPNLPASLFGGKDNNVLVLRDYSSNVRRMLQVLEKMEAR